MCVSVCGVSEYKCNIFVRELIFNGSAGSVCVMFCYCCCSYWCLWSITHIINTLQHFTNSKYDEIHMIIITRWFNILFILSSNHLLKINFVKQLISSDWTSDIDSLFTNRQMIRFFNDRFESRFFLLLHTKYYRIDLYVSETKWNTPMGKLYRFRPNCNLVIYLYEVHQS